MPHVSCLALAGLALASAYTHGFSPGLRRGSPTGSAHRRCAYAGVNFSKFRGSSIRACSGDDEAGPDADLASA
eukprot:gene4525-1283_t